MDKETKFIIYKNLYEKHEKENNKRVLAAIFIISILIFIGFLYTVGIKSIEQVLIAVAFSFIFALIDLIVHVTIFGYTIHKNIDESIKLEQLKRELEEK